MTKTPLIHLDWSSEGLQFALKSKDIVVIVDTLRFSSAVVTAIAHGFTIYPVENEEQGRERAASVGAEMAGKPGSARFSLSPLSFLHPQTENRAVVLYSPNGAACASLIHDEHTAFIGCLLNARAVAEQAYACACTTGKNVTVVACGEQRALATGERIIYLKEDAQRVFAIEDYLACGAIISAVTMAKTSEAEVCEAAFRACKDRLFELLLGSFSGRYLQEKELITDVEHAAQLNLYDIVPVVCKGRIEKMVV